MDGYRQHEREEAACERITRRHGGDLFHRINEGNSPDAYMAATPQQALQMVVSSLRYGDNHPLHGEPTEDDDLVAALVLVSAARRSLDYDEMMLMDHAQARHRDWQRIADAGAYGGPVAAQRRFEHLCARFPGYEPVSQESEDAQREW
ncbi:hypothetical protein [Streptomyces fuscigenes]|uniref:hypothetical protein n=1 Tax=Streptomyces fuscigenes TaxID=1528880 RepID=UPI001F3833ED|nr:hypothetical protein [Streptomyces fuscigenes]MCF3960241.1 hypothetical protein [Streptomyces fuscigenes]